VAQGAIPKGRGFEPHRCHFANPGRLVLITCVHVPQPTRICKMSPVAAKASACSFPAVVACPDGVSNEKRNLIGGVAQRRRISRSRGWEFASTCPHCLLGKPAHHIGIFLHLLVGAALFDRADCWHCIHACSRRMQFFASRITKNMRRRENPATRNRTRDHLIAAALYSQMLYQLSYSRPVG
jgi:hypothetical protein